MGDFGTAWRMVDDDGVSLRLGGRDELLDRRAGVGRERLGCTGLFLLLRESLVE